MPNLPLTPEAFLMELRSFQSTLVQTQQAFAPPTPGWYPFDSFTGLELGLQLIAPIYPELAHTFAKKSVADIDCGDGDLALLFAHFGCQVDAVDYPPTNYNKMAGVEKLADYVRLPIQRHCLNLDARFEFPNHYGFALLLGTLYHLQNPYYILERLAHHTDWCLLSTRVAQRTWKTGSYIADESLAYLASGIEINNDATNYWIFSLSGLLRIVQRTRWAVRGVLHAGCLTNSNPSAPDADERVFLLLQSRVSFPGLQARPAVGWYEAEGETFCWTKKRFTLKIVLPLERNFTRFSLMLYIPEAVLPSVKIQAYIDQQQCASATFTTEGIQQLGGVFSPSALHDPDLTMEFHVDSAFHHLDRELGICVPLENGSVPLQVF